MGLKLKVLVRKESGRKHFKIIQPQVKTLRVTVEQLGCGQAASGDHGSPVVGAGAASQGTGGSILISISAPHLLRSLPGFLLSGCQL